MSSSSSSSDTELQGPPAAAPEEPKEEQWVVQWCYHGWFPAADRWGGAAPLARPGTAQRSTAQAVKKGVWYP